MQDSAFPIKESCTDAAEVIDHLYKADECSIQGDAEDEVKILH